MIEQNIPLLKIHKLTQEQYERQVAANTVEENAIYLTPTPDVDNFPIKDSENLISSGGVFEALQNIVAPDFSVTSVNGKTGDVELTPEDIGALDEETLPNAINTALSQAKTSGEFDGPQGPAGRTPIKGEDYFTNADKEEFLEQVITDPFLENTYATKNFVNEIANGKCKSYVFDYASKTDPNYIKDLDAENKTVLDDWLEINENTVNLKTGDVFLIRDIGVPDYWWDENTSNKQILETTKVPLEEYAKLTDLNNYVKTVNGQNGDVIVPVLTALSQLSTDSTHRVVTDSQISTWNAKSNFSGSYNDLTNKPTVVIGDKAYTINVSNSAPVSGTNENVITFVMGE